MRSVKHAFEKNGSLDAEGPCENEMLVFTERALTRAGPVDEPRLQNWSDHFLPGAVLHRGAALSLLCERESSPSAPLIDEALRIVHRAAQFSDVDAMHVTVEIEVAIVK